MYNLIIGTRSSTLALWQTEWVASRLQTLYPDLSVEIRRIATHGDRARHVPLPQIGAKGAFTREIESALLNGEIHLAVHSLKDLPTELPPGLTLGAITAREDARDVVVSRLGLTLSNLGPGARVGTSSTRRAAQLLARRPDLRIGNLRGNVDTRLRKAVSGEYDAIVLAAAGVLRLGSADRITEYLSLDVMLPAVGQGALAVEARADDLDTLRRIAALDHPPTRAATTGERAFLRALGGGCHMPIAAYGETCDKTLRLHGLIASPDGRRIARGEMEGLATAAEAVGQALAARLLAQGGQEMIQA